MKIVLATSNHGKVKEIKDFYKDYEILALNEIMSPFEIEENGQSFKENALIKVKAVAKKLNLNEFIVLSDDSGISVDIFDGVPGIYSARFSGENATDASNRAKLISMLKEKNIKKTPAYYTACIAIATKFGDFTTHGFMHGSVIDEERGNNGFGYDFMFIPKGFDNTTAELSLDIKLQISHRSNGLRLMGVVLKNLKKYYD